jgi:hypothetical protein
MYTAEDKIDLEVEFRVQRWFTDDESPKPV